MAFTTENIRTGDGNTTDFSFTFPYINESDVKVTITDANGVPQPNTAFTFANATTLSFTSAPLNNRTIRIFRDTNLDNAEVTFFAGSAIRAEDLNDNQNQVLFSAQEVENNAILLTGGTMTGPLVLDDTTLQIQEGSDTLTIDAPALSANRTISFPDVSGTVVTTGDTDTVTSDMLTDNIDIAGTLDVTGATTLDSTLTVAGNIDANGDLDVDGTTNLDNVDIDGTVHVQSTSTFVGEITASGGVTGDVTGDLTGTATNATHVTVTDNESTNENNLIPFIEDTSATGNVGLESDGDFHYNPSTGTVTATTFSGALAGNATTATNLVATASVTNAEQAAHTANDTSYFTTAASDARYFNVSTGDTIKDGDAFPDNDTTIATTAAINDRIIDLVDNVGGFVPIANETSFPAENPDVNDGAGTIVSIAEIVTSRTPSNGTVTIANGQGSNTVTINNCGTTVLADGFGCLVETTTTLNTYNFHRLTPKSTEVTTVAGNNANITTVATNIADINTVADDLNENTSDIETVANSIANVNTVGGAIANVNTVATNIADVNNFADVYQISGSEPTTRSDSSALEEGDLCYRTDLDVIQVFDGSDYSNITPDQATINDITIVADDLASFTDLGSVADDLVANQSGGALETCADNIADIRTLADIENGTDATDAIQTVANISANVTTVAGRDTEISRLGTADAVADMAILGTTDVVADMAILGTADVVADLNTLATSDIVDDLETCANNNANITTVADDIANVNSVGGSIANVNTVAGSIDDVNRYANEYTISANAPGSPSEGDLWYDDTNNVLKFYNGTAFASISAGISQIADDTSPEISSSASQLDMNSKNITEVGTISGNNMAMDFGSVTDT